MTNSNSLCIRLIPVKPFSRHFSLTNVWMFDGTSTHARPVPTSKATDKSYVDIDGPRSLLHLAKKRRAERGLAGSDRSNHPDQSARLDA